MEQDTSGSEIDMSEWIIALAAAAIGIGLAAAGIWSYMRRRYIAYTEEVCGSIDRILAGEKLEEQSCDEDTLFSKVQMKLERLREITAVSAQESEERKLEVQGIVSDISHQLKTPIANVVMYCDTAVNPELTEEDRAKCMEILRGQVGKLDFLVQSLMRMSRMEQNMITIRPEKVSLARLMEDAAQSVAAQAGKKGIIVKTECPEEVYLYCDERWTLEAIFNVLDNAVKYSPDGGTVVIRSRRMEIYTAVVVEDGGFGISPEHINDVCKRFFREDRVKRTEGLGIGLYLTREILEKESGYLRIRSQVNRGTEVSLFLLNYHG